MESGTNQETSSTVLEGTQERKTLADYLYEGEVKGKFFVSSYGNTQIYEITGRPESASSIPAINHKVGVMGGYHVSDFPLDLGRVLLLVEATDEEINNVKNAKEN